LSFIALRKEELGRWWVFLKERFDPLSHVVMILLFVGAHYQIVSSRLNFLEMILVFVVVTLFFIKLRLYDELKDYELDVVINPTRPLPRGLLTQTEVKRTIEKIILFEIAIFAGLGAQALVSGFIVIGYSLLMYKEFFIPKLIRPHLTTYATTHTVVTFFLSLAIFSSFTKEFIWQFSSDKFYFALMSWLLFNIFELGRKTYQKSEEREGVPTYSNVWGRYGAVILVLVHCILAGYFLTKTNLPQIITQNLFILAPSLMFLMGVLYLFINQKWSAKLYRGFSSFYIVIVYLTILTTYFIK
jgi:hypothetical protein